MYLKKLHAQHTIPSGASFLSMLSENVKKFNELSPVRFISQCTCNDINDLTFYLSVIIWNIRGIDSLAARRGLKHLCRNYSPMVIAISEPKISLSRENALCHSLRMHGVFGNDGEDSKIWVFWQVEANVEVVDSSFQRVTFASRREEEVEANEVSFGSMPSETNRMSSLSKVGNQIFSQAGWITLINSVLSSLPIYLAAATVLPKTVICFLNRACTSLFWNGSNGSRRRRWIPWAVIQRPILEGGLGIRCLWHVQLSLATKQLWNMQHASSLWARYARCRQQPLQGFPKEVYLTASNLISNNTRWLLRYGQTIDFLHDLWAGKDPLRLSLDDPASAPHASKRVCVFGLLRLMGMIISTICSDSAVLVNSITSATPLSRACLQWWRPAVDIIQKYGASISHVYREANQVADALASYSCQTVHNEVYLCFGSLPWSCRGPATPDGTGLPSASSTDQEDEPQASEEYASA
ncbi:hypothetical protein Taro_009408 [Colocasia esculenta]|uniref:RNase H type-1 domain-containing protein n=1 Tax=Colocasia esculenta TaxID=4460 RepID=A0A843U403_COLES|nr:hypothetical protein [Colocasia esculenta]